MLFFRSKGIKREKADSEMKVALEIEDIAAPIMQARLEEMGNNRGVQYFKGGFNAFIFQKDSVLKYFYGTNVPLTPDGAAEYLAVITGAHDVDETVDDDEFKAGHRTSIICGMNEKQDENGNPVLDEENNPILVVTSPTFVLGPEEGSQKNPFVADQYPPHRIFSVLPPIVGSLEIVIKK